MASGTIRQVLFVTSLSIGWLLLVYGLPGTGSSIALPLLSSVCLSVYLLGCLSVYQSKPNTNKNQLNIKNALKILKERLNSDFVFLLWKSFYAKHFSSIYQFKRTNIWAIIFLSIHIPVIKSYLILFSNKTFCCLKITLIYALKLHIVT